MAGRTQNGTSKWIDDALFTTIRGHVPLVCIDLLIVHNGRLLLMLRNNAPAKDLWFTPGGRVHIGEKLEGAVRRILHKETKLTPLHIEQKGAMAHFWPSIHTVTVFYLVTVSTEEVTMNEEHRDYKWIASPPNTLHPYVKEMIKRSNVFPNEQS